MNSITSANLQKTARIAHRPRGKLQISTWRSDVSLSSTLYQHPLSARGKFDLAGGYVLFCIFALRYLSESIA